MPRVCESGNDFSCCCRQSGVIATGFMEQQAPHCAKDAAHIEANFQHTWKGKVSAYTQVNSLIRFSKPQ